ncbi:uncharacterized protein [Panulirus ornatus]|uniref:uncharacterized protein isoform X4 n=1 Tax=Panulirus ornatus TaxID=150431 RepID=UPI003A89B45B
MGDRARSLTIDGVRLIKDLKVVELKAELERRGLSKSGSKKELVERLRSSVQFENTKSKATAAVNDEDVPNRWLQNEANLDNDFIREYFQSQKALYRQQIEARRQYRETAGATAALSEAASETPAVQSTVPESTPEGSQIGVKNSIGSVCREESKVQGSDTGVSRTETNVISATALGVTTATPSVKTVIAPTSKNTTTFAAKVPAVPATKTISASTVESVATPATKVPNIKTNPSAHTSNSFPTTAALGGTQIIKQVVSKQGTVTPGNVNLSTAPPSKVSTTAPANPTTSRERLLAPLTLKVKKLRGEVTPAPTPETPSTSSNCCRPSRSSARTARVLSRASLRDSEEEDDSEEEHRLQPLRRSRKRSVRHLHGQEDPDYQVNRASGSPYSDLKDRVPSLKIKLPDPVPIASVRTPLEEKPKKRIESSSSAKKGLSDLSNAKCRRTNQNNKKQISDHSQETDISLLGSQSSSSVCGSAGYQESSGVSLTLNKNDSSDRKLSLKIIPPVTESLKQSLRTTQSKSECHLSRDDSGLQGPGHANLRPIVSLKRLQNIPQSDLQITEENSDINKNLDQNLQEGEEYKSKKVNALVSDEEIVSESKGKASVEVADPHLGENAVEKRISVIISTEEQQQSPNCVDQKKLEIHNTKERLAVVDRNFALNEDLKDKASESVKLKKESELQNEKSNLVKEVQFSSEKVEGLCISSADTDIRKQSEESIQSLGDSSFLLPTSALESKNSCLSSDSLNFQEPLIVSTTLDLKHVISEVDDSSGKTDSRNSNSDSFASKTTFAGKKLNKKFEDETSCAVRGEIFVKKEDTCRGNSVEESEETKTQVRDQFSHSSLSPLSKTANAVVPLPLKTKIWEKLLDTAQKKGDSIKEPTKDPCKELANKGESSRQSQNALDTPHTETECLERESLKEESSLPRKFSGELPYDLQGVKEFPASCEVKQVHSNHDSILEKSLTRRDSETRPPPCSLINVAGTFKLEKEENHSDDEVEKGVTKIIQEAQTGQDDVLKSIVKSLILDVDSVKKDSSLVIEPEHSEGNLCDHVTEVSKKSLIHEESFDIKVELNPFCLPQDNYDLDQLDLSQHISTSERKKEIQENQSGQAKASLFVGRRNTRGSPCEAEALDENCSKKSSVASCRGNLPEVSVKGGADAESLTLTGKQDLTQDTKALFGSTLQSAGNRSITSKTESVKASGASSSKGIIYFVGKQENLPEVTTLFEGREKQIHSLATEREENASEHNLRCGNKETSKSENWSPSVLLSDSGVAEGAALSLSGDTLQKQVISVKKTDLFTPKTNLKGEEKFLPSSSCAADKVVDTVDSQVCIPCKVGEPKESVESKDCSPHVAESVHSSCVQSADWCKNTKNIVPFSQAETELSTLEVRVPSFESTEDSLLQSGSSSLTKSSESISSGTKAVVERKAESPTDFKPVLAKSDEIFNSNTKPVVAKSEETSKVDTNSLSRSEEESSLETKFIVKRGEEKSTSDLDLTSSKSEEKVILGTRPAGERRGETCISDTNPIVGGSEEKSSRLLLTRTRVECDLNTKVNGKSEGRSESDLELGLRRSEGKSISEKKPVEAKGKEKSYADTKSAEAAAKEKSDSDTTLFEAKSEEEFNTDTKSVELRNEYITNLEAKLAIGRLEEKSDLDQKSFIPKGKNKSNSSTAPDVGGAEKYSDINRNPVEEKQELKSDFATKPVVGRSEQISATKPKTESRENLKSSTELVLYKEKTCLGIKPSVVRSKEKPSVDTASVIHSEDFSSDKKPDIGTSREKFYFGAEAFPGRCEEKSNSVIADPIGAKCEKDFDIDPRQFSVEWEERSKSGAKPVPVRNESKFISNTQPLVGSSKEKFATVGKSENRSTSDKKPVEVGSEGQLFLDIKPVISKSEDKPALDRKPVEEGSKETSESDTKPVTGKREARSVSDRKFDTEVSEKKSALDTKPAVGGSEEELVADTKSDIGKSEAKYTSDTRLAEVRSEEKCASDTKPIEVQGEEKSTSDTRPIEIRSEDKSLGTKPFVGKSEVTSILNLKPVEGRNEYRSASDTKPVEVRNRERSASDSKPVVGKSESKTSLDRKPVEVSNKEKSASDTKPLEVRSEEKSCVIKPVVGKGGDRSSALDQKSVEVRGEDKSTSGEKSLSDTKPVVVKSENKTASEKLPVEVRNEKSVSGTKFADVRSEKSAFITESVVGKSESKFVADREPVEEESEKSASDSKPVVGKVEYNSAAKKAEVRSEKFASDTKLVEKSEDLSACNIKPAEVRRERKSTLDTKPVVGKSGEESTSRGSENKTTSDRKPLHGRSEGKSASDSKPVVGSEDRFSSERKPGVVRSEEKSALNAKTVGVRSEDNLAVDIKHFEAGSGEKTSDKESVPTRKEPTESVFIVPWGGSKSIPDRKYSVKGEELFASGKESQTGFPERKETSIPLIESVLNRNESDSDIPCSVTKTEDEPEAGKALRFIESLSQPSLESEITIRDQASAKSELKATESVKKFASSSVSEVVDARGEGKLTSELAAASELRSKTESTRELEAIQTTAVKVPEVGSRVTFTSGLKAIETGSEGKSSIATKSERERKGKCTFVNVAGIKVEHTPKSNVVVDVERFGPEVKNPSLLFTREESVSRKYGVHEENQIVKQDSAIIHEKSVGSRVDIDCKNEYSFKSNPGYKDLTITVAANQVLTDLEESAQALTFASSFCALQPDVQKHKPSHLSGKPKQDTLINTSQQLQFHSVQGSDIDISPKSLNSSSTVEDKKVNDYKNSKPFNLVLAGNENLESEVNPGVPQEIFVAAAETGTVVKPESISLSEKNISQDAVKKFGSEPSQERKLCKVEISAVDIQKDIPLVKGVTCQGNLIIENVKEKDIKRESTEDLPRKAQDPFILVTKEQCKHNSSGSAITSFSDLAHEKSINQGVELKHQGLTDVSCTTEVDDGRSLKSDISRDHSQSPLKGHKTRSSNLESDIELTTSESCAYSKESEKVGNRSQCETLSKLQDRLKDDLKGSASFLKGEGTLKNCTNISKEVLGERSLLHTEVSKVSECSVKIPDVAPKEDDTSCATINYSGAVKEKVCLFRSAPTEEQVDTIGNLAFIKEEVHVGAAVKKEEGHILEITKEVNRVSTAASEESNSVSSGSTDQGDHSGLSLVTRKKVDPRVQLTTKTEGHTHTSTATTKSQAHCLVGSEATKTEACPIVSVAAAKAEVHSPVSTASTKSEVQHIVSTTGTKFEDHRPVHATLTENLANPCIENHPLLKTTFAKTQVTPTVSSSSTKTIVHPLVNTATTKKEACSLSTEPIKTEVHPVNTVATKTEVLPVVTEELNKTEAYSPLSTGCTERSNTEVHRIVSVTAGSSESVLVNKVFRPQSVVSTKTEFCAVSTALTKTGVFPVLSTTPAKTEVCPVVSTTPAKTEVCPVVSTTTAETEVFPVVSTAAAEREVCPVVSKTTAETEVSPVVSTTDAETEVCPVVSATTAETEVCPVVSTTTAKTEVCRVVSTSTAKTEVCPVVSTTTAKTEVCSVVSTTTSKTEFCPVVSTTTSKTEVCPVVSTTAAKTKVCSVVSTSAAKTEVCPVVSTTTSKTEVCPVVSTTAAKTEVCPVVSTTTKTEVCVVVSTTLTKARVSSVVSTTTSKTEGSPVTCSETTKTVVESPVSTSSIKTEIDSLVSTATTDIEVCPVSTATTNQGVGLVVSTASLNKELCADVKTTAANKEVCQVISLATREDIRPVVSVTATSKEVCPVVSITTTNTEIYPVIKAAFAKNKEVCSVVNTAPTTKVCPVVSTVTSKGKGPVVGTASANSEVCPTANTALTDKVLVVSTVANKVSPVSTAPTNKEVCLLGSTTTTSRLCPVTASTTSKEVCPVVDTVITTTSKEVCKGFSTGITIKEVIPVVSAASANKEACLDVTSATTNKEITPTVSTVTTSRKDCLIVRTATAGKGDCSVVSSATAKKEVCPDFSTATTKKEVYPVDSTTTKKDICSVVSIATTKEEVCPVFTTVSTSKGAFPAVKRAVTSKEGCSVSTATTNKVCPVVSTATTKKYSLPVDSTALASKGVCPVSAAATSKDVCSVVSASTTSEGVCTVSASATVKEVCPVVSTATDKEVCPIGTATKSEEVCQVVSKASASKEVYPVVSTSLTDKKACPVVCVATTDTAVCTAVGSVSSNKGACSVINTTSANTDFTPYISSASKAKGPVFHTTLTKTEADQVFDTSTPKAGVSPLVSTTVTSKEVFSDCSRANSKTGTDPVVWKLPSKADFFPVGSTLPLKAGFNTTTTKEEEFSVTEDSKNKRTSLDEERVHKRSVIARKSSPPQSEPASIQTGSSISSTSDPQLSTHLTGSNTSLLILKSKKHIGGSEVSCDEEEILNTNKVEVSRERVTEYLNREKSDFPKGTVTESSVDKEQRDTSGLEFCESSRIKIGDYSEGSVEEGTLLDTPESKRGYSRDNISSSFSAFSEISAILCYLHNLETGIIRKILGPQKISTKNLQ